MSSKKQAKPHVTETIAWGLQAAAFFLVTLPVGLLPRRPAIFLGRLVGWAMYHLLGRRRRVALENIEASLPCMRSRNPDLANVTAESIARGCFRNLGICLIETLKLYYGTGGSLMESVEVRGEENLLKAREPEAGIFFITGHCGNWELMALAFGVRYGKVSVVARPQNNPLLNTFVEKMRSRYGNSIIYKKGAFRRIVATLREQGIVGVLIDQSVKRDESCAVEFLGRKALATKMPALMARKTGAPMLPIFISRKPDGGHLITIEPQIFPSECTDHDEAVRLDTQALTGCVERYVVRNPAEWYWVHRRWKRTAQNPEKRAE